MFSMGMALGQGFGVGLAHRSGLEEGHRFIRYWPRGKVDRRLGTHVVRLWVNICLGLSSGG